MLRLSKSAFLDLVRQHPDIHLNFTRLLAERLRFKFLVIKEIATHGPEQCITTLLNYFKLKQKYTSDNGTRVLLTRQQIADMTGMRVETVIRAIRSLHQQGKVVIQRGKVFC